MLIIFFAAVLTPGWYITSHRSTCFIIYCGEFNFRYDLRCFICRINRGIKLASYAMLIHLFSVPIQYAAIVSSIYVAVYAFGRLFSGILANSIGIFRTYDIIIIGMLVLLLILPQVTYIPILNNSQFELNFCYLSLQTSSSMPHDSASSRGCTVFVVLISIIGLLYGGAIALFYSIVFDIFGSRNYKAGS